MEIGNAIGLQSLTATQQTNSVSQTKDGGIEGIAVEPRSSNNISLSSEGKLSQQIDAASEKIDDILLRHVTPQQEKELDGIYKKLDQLFEKDQLSIEEERTADALFEQVHNILETSVDKLSGAELATVDKLVGTMDGLMAKFEQQDFGGSSKDSARQANSLSDIAGSGQVAGRKKLSVAELNALSVMELNKLPANQLKKLNAGQLNKLNAAQLNTLSSGQLNQLSASNVEKLNASQAEKIAKG